MFDTCNVKAGRAYGLDFHLDRLLRSASLARITHPYTKVSLHTSTCIVHMKACLYMHMDHDVANVAQMLRLIV